MACSRYFFATADEGKKWLDGLRLRGRGPAVQRTLEIEREVASILEKVRGNGLESIVEYTRHYDAPDFTQAQFVIEREALAGACAALEPDDRALLEEAISNVRQFHECQKENSWFMRRDDGSILGQQVLPIERVGLYVPGGTGGQTPLVSSLIMNAVPAQVAGVKEIAVISPPGKDGRVNSMILAVAHLLRLTEFYAAGSAWGIAGLAFGAGPLRSVDLIAGPGNIYVANAKRLLIGQVKIDMLAGPSEILILADEGANPDWLAADMLAQAEHDILAAAICICWSEELAERICRSLSAQCDNLPRREIALESLREQGAVLCVPDVLTAVDLANAVAPEHLELAVKNPWDLLPAIRHAGAVFMGYHAAEAFGDYFAGPNHVLPTMGTARFSSPLDVGTFYKKMSILAPSRVFAQNAAQKTARLARFEKLEGHARSALMRR